MQCHVGGEVGDVVGGADVVALGVAVVGDMLRADWEVGRLIQILLDREVEGRRRDVILAGAGEAGYYPWASPEWVSVSECVRSKRERETNTFQVHFLPFWSSNMKSSWP